MKCLQGGESGQLSQLLSALMKLAIFSLKDENSRIMQDLYDPSLASNQFKVQFLKSQPILRKYAGPSEGLKIWGCQ